MLILACDGVINVKIEITVKKTVMIQDELYLLDILWESSHKMLFFFITVKLL